MHPVCDCLFQTAYLVAILHELEGSVFMVFCATCATVLKIAYTLRNLQMHAVPLSGQMSQVCNIPIFPTICYVHTIVIGSML